ncbi:hypothetical protein PPL_07476 [Heterostelium album PN500]|uniref:Ankyrin repeat protein n=1 Tax=Heterostelium pallidum (strain ATCC 26659 / Pp 5 / PN500) TaxID=670386 RepID=D3BG25_HETP5|nr:hypothetical protein PPL_07476 [Heterostelium album PN500]EFA79617.1 hypothetical protein PPL_07476 [Heterostelium album PN500]|eukprot:XP_020431738.1 hypothetical protein PPL_07476 [Heterostelium album PN500]
MEKDKFTQIFNNFVLNKLIFKHVKSIHDVIGGAAYRWSEVIENPTVMAGYSYLNELKLYYADHSIGSYEVSATPTFRAAIKSGNIEMLKYLVDLAKPLSVTGQHINFNGILGYAVKYGGFEMVKCICTEFEKKRLDYESAFMKSPLSGDIELVEYINEKMLVANRDHLETREFDVDYDREEIFYNAAKIGRIDIIEWLLANRSEDRPEGNEMYFGAIKGGHLHVVQYLLDIDEPTTDPDHGTLFDHSIFYNQFEIAKLLHQHDITESEETPIDYAAKNGNIELLTWLNENTTVEASEEAMNNAALNNDLEVLKWLQQHRTEGCSESIIQSVSSKGHIEAVQWLYENQSGVLQSQQSIDEAITYGYLELAKWLFEKRNQQPSEDAIDYAASIASSDMTSLEMIKWLHENHPNVGCTEQAMLYAIGNGHFGTMKWLRENRTEISSSKKLDLNGFDMNNLDREAIDWLSENFIIDWDLVLFNAVNNDNSEIVDIIINQNLSAIAVIDSYSISELFRKGCRKMIRWYHNNNIPGVFNEESMKNSIGGMQFPLVKWLYENRSDCQCTFNSFKSAVESGDMGMIGYLLEKHPEFGFRTTMEDYLEQYFCDDDIEMIEFILDKIDFQLVELKKFQEKINSSSDYSDISKALLNDHIKKKVAYYGDR